MPDLYCEAQNVLHMGEDALEDVLDRLRRFVTERDWEQFHTPRNLATALSVEAAELLELFQWDTPGSQTDIAENRERITEELADIWIYSLLLADRCGIEIAQAIQNKIELNAAKYPVEKARGRSTKYDKL